jgi:hypothetical protein
MTDGLITNRGWRNILGLFFRDEHEPTSQFYVKLYRDSIPPARDMNDHTEMTEITGGNGYYAGGQLLERSAVGFDVLTEDDTTHFARIEVRDVSWTAGPGGSIPSGGTGARYMGLYDYNNNDLIAVFDLETNRSVTANQTMTIKNPKIKLQMSA